MSLKWTHSLCAIVLVAGLLFLPCLQAAAAPPAHAPAHGYRVKHKYRYYPDKEVYHDADRGLYFYLSGDGWKAGVELPDSIKLQGDGVALELDTSEPYSRHDEIRKKYPH